MVTYSDKPWLKHYDPGVPHSLEPYPDKAVHELSARKCRQSAGQAQR